MATAVLRSHDCLKDRLHLDYYDYRPPPPMNNSPSPSRKKPSTRTRSKPNPTRSSRRSGSPPGKENSKSRLVMGQVTILKRGEELKQDPPAPVDLRSDGDDSSVLCSTNRLGPDTGILPKIADLTPVYAGPAFITSPSPSSVPYPFFLKKGADVATTRSEMATRGLRCLLRLDEMV